jgi:hypothetical protein
MQFASIILYTLSAAALGAATPVDVKESRGGTCLQYPPAYGNYQITQTVKPVLTFYPPAGSPGPCSLVAKFPAGYAGISNTGYSLVNVFSIGGPAPGALVGTLRFRSSPSEPTYVTVNSFSCRQTMSYRLEIADGNVGSVAFSEVPGAGLFMIAGDPC